MTGRHRMLRRVMLTDAWVSFYAPVLLIGSVPVLMVLDVASALVFAVVIALAAILGGCGILMAGFLAWTMRGEDGKFVDEFEFDLFRLEGAAGTKGWHVPY
ncbi:MAG: hypothetical protein ACT4QF_03155 [Sporichthyaceae bacterium]|jgi:hypothetical protein